MVIAGIASEVFYGTAKLVIDLCKNSTTDAILLTEPRWIRDGYYGGEGAVSVVELDWCLNDYPLSESASASEIIRRGQPIFWSIVIGSAAMLLGLIFLVIVVVYTRHRVGTTRTRTT